MAGLLQDLRYALRQLRKSPGFNVSAVFILALMVGAASAVVSVIYAELIRPLPYANPERIFCLQPYAAEGYQQSVSYPDYIDWRRENHAFSALAAYGAVSSNFEGPAGPAAIPTVAATDDFFNVLGVSPILGRTFAPGEDLPGGNNVVVLSYEVWKQDFAAQQSAIGRQVKINGTPGTVIGVMPAGFRFPITSRSAIYRAVVDERVVRVEKKKVKFIDDPLYHQPDAAGAIEAIVDQEVIGEEHHLPQTRSLYESLLRLLWRRGYRYLAAETFTETIITRA